jgi:hypothetical protein
MPHAYPLNLDRELTLYRQRSFPSVEVFPSSPSCSRIRIFVKELDGVAHVADPINPAVLVEFPCPNIGVYEDLCACVIFARGVAASRESFRDMTVQSHGRCESESTGWSDSFRPGGSDSESEVPSAAPDVRIKR